MDTIFAPATAAGRAGVSVIRISGPEAFAAGEFLTGAPVPLRRPVLRRVMSDDGRHLDTALVIGFGEAASFTGEPTVEIQAHGSVAVVDAILAALDRIDGLRMAEAGEFTRRALENERLDLAQVEALADLIDAETELQRRQALAVLDGALGRLAEGWRSKLLRAVALLEATIDFADEEVPEDVSDEVAALVSAVLDELRHEVEGSAISERVREGFQVAIVGAPNVGKSTLLNALAGREAAITSDVAGTTRDVIEVRMDLQGIPVTILDTAGIRETEDPVEGIGVARARARSEAADIRILLVSADAPETVLSAGEEDVVVYGKCDLERGPGLNVSGLTGAGLDVLVDAVAKRLRGRIAGSGTAIRVRQRMAMEEALRYGFAARDGLDAGSVRAEFAADDLRKALRALEMLLGRVDVEDVLDVIFESFCLGK